MPQRQTLSGLSHALHSLLPQLAIDWFWFRQHFLPVPEDFELHWRNLVGTSKLPQACKEAKRRRYALKRACQRWWKELINSGLRIQSTDRGLGLFAQEPLALQPRHAPSVFGSVIQVDEAYAHLLHVESFGYRFGDTGIMVGPLSLVNHACDAPFGFSSAVDSGLFDTNIRTRVATVRLKVLTTTQLEPGTELEVNYGTDRLCFVCKCQKCNPSP